MTDIAGADFEELQERYKALCHEEAELEDDLKFIRHDIDVVEEQMQMYRLKHPEIN